MTERKDALHLPPRTPAYVSREVGAAELCVSPATWDQWVRDGILPKPIGLGISGTTPRWRWVDVDLALSGKSAEASHSPPEPYFGELAGGTPKERRRGAS